MYYRCHKCGGVFPASEFKTGRQLHGPGCRAYGVHPNHRYCPCGVSIDWYGYDYVEMEKLGTGRFTQLLDVIEVDRDYVGIGVNKKEAALYRSREIDPIAGEHLQFVNVICHSTEREYMLCVPPDIKDVWTAVGWTFNKTKSEYAPVVEA
ncbi:MAG: hypothetical protein HPY66_1714 [Firmicutes bacterium]|nr:hypothetical protein [Bacillota bacterium]